MAMLLGHISAIEAYDLLGLFGAQVSLTMPGIAMPGIADDSLSAPGIAGDSLHGLSLPAQEHASLCGAADRTWTGSQRGAAAQAKARTPRGTTTTTVSGLGNDTPWTSVEALTLLGPTGIDSARLAKLDMLPKPLHLIVSRRAGIHATSETIPHGWSYEQPLDDLVHLEVEGTRLYVCPPEMAAMQMARRLSRGKLALLIDQLAGSYRIIRPEAVPYYRQLRGVTIELYPKGSNDDTCRSATAYGLKPLTAVEMLGSYVAAMPKAMGSLAVRRALTLAANNLASPLEAQQFALAFCGRINGSLGITAPKVNEPLEVPLAIRTFTGSNTIRPDFFWPQAEVALEVNGAGWHTGDKGIADTSRRQKAYEQMGIRCETLTSSEMFNLNQYTAAMEHLADLIGHKLPEETDHFRVARSRLRTEVLDLTPRNDAPPEDDDGWLEYLLRTN